MPATRPAENKTDFAYRALCQSCGRQGKLRDSSTRKPSWCRCGGKGRRGGPGPFVAAPGTIIRYTFETRDAAAFRERCAEAARAVFAAKDAISEARWAEHDDDSPRPDSHPRVRSALLAFGAAIRAERRLQAECPHDSRSMFNPLFCDVCHAQVECNVEHFRHLVREIGSRNARRLAV